MCARLICSSSFQRHARESVEAFIRDRHMNTNTQRHTFGVTAVHGVQQEWPALLRLIVPPQDGLKGIVPVGAGAAGDCVVERDPCRIDTVLGAPVFAWTAMQRPDPFTGGGRELAVGSS